MKKLIKHIPYILLLNIILFSIGCASKTTTEESITSQELAQKNSIQEDKNEEDEIGGNEEEESIIVSKAQSMLGVKYKYGGTTTQGFDCSGFVQWVYNQAGVSLPRTARAQSKAGVHVKKKDIQVGDIVTFRHARFGYHTGIYLGDGKFIHSPRRNKRIQISDLSVSYFSKYYTGTRRVAELGLAEEEAATELLLAYENKTKK